MESSRIYKSVLEGIAEAVFVCDRENRILYLNPAAEKLTGRNLSDLLGKTSEDIFSILDPSGRLADALLHSGHHKNGFLSCGRDFQYSLSPLLEDGEQNGSVVLLRESAASAKTDTISSIAAEDELRRRDRILAGVALAINQLIITVEKDAAINQALEILGCSADVDRVYIFMNVDGESGERMHRLQYEWARDTVEPQIKRIGLDKISYQLLPQWYETLSGGMPIKGLTRTLPDEAKKFLQSLDVLSFLVVPVFEAGNFWGFIGFNDCSSERTWTWCEVSLLLTMAGAIGGSMARWHAEEELRKSEEKYRELVENSNSIIMRRDTTGKITFFNEFAQKFFGYSQEDVLGRNVVGTIVPAVDSSGQDLRMMVEDIGKHPENYASNINENMRSNGERVFIAWTNRPVRNDKGEVVELLCIGNDITERKLAEERLRTAHEHLLGIIEFLPDATFVIDRDKNVIAWNKAIEDMTGVRKEEVLGKGDFIYGLPFYGTPRPMLIDLIEGENEEIESMYIYVERDGGKLYAEAFVPSLSGGAGVYVWATASPLYDSKGQVIGAIESIRDITELKMASETLKKRDVLLAGVAAAANALLVTHDFEVEINQALEILGLSANVDRAYIFQNHISDEGKTLVSLKYEWCREGIAQQINNPSLQSCSYEQFFPRWYGILASGEVISGSVKDFPKTERAIIAPREAASLVVVPITLGDAFWGFIGFDDCSSERVWSRTEISILRTAAGSIGATIERKQALEELRKTHDYLENLIGYANAPIIVWDPSFRITRFNRAFERLTGLKASGVLGKPLDILFPDESRDESLAYIRRTLTGERWDVVEIPILRQDGDVRTVLWNSATLYDKDGRTIIATIAQGQDITDRKQAQEQVKYQASLLDQVRNAVVATDLKGSIVYWNKFSEILHQWNAAEVIGRNIAETVVPEDKIDLMHEVMANISHAGYWEGELLVKRKDGSIFPAFCVFNTLKDTQGQNAGFVGVSVDITERKRAEEDLRRAKDRAESATKAKSQFLANMSHEIRTPMNAVIGLTGLLLNTELNSDQRDYVETIRYSGDALMAIINDILDFSKIEGGRMEMERQPFDLVDCIDASLDLVAQSAARKGLALSYSLDSKVPQRIVGDVTRLRQVIVNLLSNAVKFTEYGEISVTVTCMPAGSGYEIKFSVRDTGIGISKGRMDRLFQTFSQVDASTTRKYGGTGLGLAISRRLVEMMGGRIWAESKPGKGSTFYFTIMAEMAEAAQSSYTTETTKALFKAVSGTSAKRIAPVQEAFLEYPQKPMRILLAEDNAVNQKVALRMLERLGYRADVAANGVEVIQALERLPYDVVLMDIQMPDMDGLESTRRIRSLPGRGPYIIAMTAHAMKGDREDCLSAGMNDYVSKPVRIEELQAALMRSTLQENCGPAIDKIVLEELRKLQMEGEPDIVQELGSMFLARVPARIEAMRNALDKGDTGALKREAHNLKSSSANVGALLLSGLFKDLETVGRSGDLQGAQELMKRVNAEFERVREALEAEISEGGCRLENQRVGN